jgi:hypothetical protein
MLAPLEDAMLWALFVHAALASQYDPPDVATRSLEEVVAEADLIFVARSEGCYSVSAYGPVDSIRQWHCDVTVVDELLGSVASGRVRISLGQQLGALPVDQDLLVFGHGAKFGCETAVCGSRVGGPYFSDLIVPAFLGTVFYEADDAGVRAFYRRQPEWLAGYHDLNELRDAVGKLVRTTGAAGRDMPGIE